MAIFEKFRGLEEVRAGLLKAGIDPFNVTLERIHSATEADIRGKRTILAGTNNYLGLTFDPECIKASCTAAQEQGTGTTGSRMANGTFAGHVALEKEFASFYQRRGAIVFSTGYIANLAMLSTLAGPDDVILLDADSHASIYDGCRLGGAEVVRFRHNDPEDLEKRLRRLGDRASNTLIVVEGIYSMLGDVAPLADIAAIKKSYGAWLLVDEAHSLGIVGKRGRGLAEEVGVEEDVDFVVGTFSKSLGATGGYCVSDHPELDAIRYAGRPYIFTASPSPSVIASTRKALEILQARPELRTQLWNNARSLYNRLAELGFTLGPQISPVVAVRLSDKKEAFGAWMRLLEQGVYVNLVLPPAAPDGSALLRCSMSAAHTPGQIHHIVQAFSTLSNSAAASKTA
jgi:8-amino-7-oxononanoate synthase